MVISFYEPHDTPEKDKIVVIVNKQGQVTERLLSFPKNSFVWFIADYGLSISEDKHTITMPPQIWANSFASTNMREQFDGLKSLILSETPNAWYIPRSVNYFQSEVVSATKSISFFFRYKKKSISFITDFFPIILLDCTYCGLFL